MNKRQYIYESIIRDKLGKEKLFEIDQIKEEQCIYCEKCGKRNCRMNIQDSKCINYRGDLKCGI